MTRRARPLSMGPRASSGMRIRSSLPVDWGESLIIWEEMTEDGEAGRRYTEWWWGGEEKSERHLLEEKKEHLGKDIK